MNLNYQNFLSSIKTEKMIVCIQFLFQLLLWIMKKVQKVKKYSSCGGMVEPLEECYLLDFIGGFG